MSTLKVRIDAPAQLYRSGDVTVMPDGGFEYVPRFLRDSSRRAAGVHHGVGITFEAKADDGRTGLTVSALLVIDGGGNLRLLREEDMAPSFFEAKTDPA